jgi:hypothetical protein
MWYNVPYLEVLVENRGLIQAGGGGDQQSSECTFWTDCSPQRGQRDRVISPKQYILWVVRRGPQLADTPQL